MGAGGEHVRVDRDGWGSPIRRRLPQTVAQGRSPTILAEDGARSPTTPAKVPVGTHDVAVAETITAVEALTMVAVRPEQLGMPIDAVNTIGELRRIAEERAKPHEGADSRVTVITGDVNLMAVNLARRYGNASPAQLAREFRKVLCGEIENDYFTSLQGPAGLRSAVIGAIAGTFGFNNVTARTSKDFFAGNPDVATEAMVETPLARALAGKDDIQNMVCLNPDAPSHAINYITLGALMERTLPRRVLDNPGASADIQHQCAYALAEGIVGAAWARSGTEMPGEKRFYASYNGSEKHRDTTPSLTIIEYMKWLVQEVFKQFCASDMNGTQIAEMLERNFVVDSRLDGRTLKLDKAHADAPPSDPWTLDENGGGMVYRRVALVVPEGEKLRSAKTAEIRPVIVSDSGGMDGQRRSLFISEAVPALVRFVSGPCGDANRERLVTRVSEPSRALSADKVNTWLDGLVDYQRSVRDGVKGVELKDDQLHPREPADVVRALKVVSEAVCDNLPPEYRADSAGEA